MSELLNQLESRIAELNGKKKLLESHIADMTKHGDSFYGSVVTIMLDLARLSGAIDGLYEAQRTIAKFYQANSND